MVPILTATTAAISVIATTVIAWRTGHRERQERSRLATREAREPFAPELPLGYTSIGKRATSSSQSEHVA